MSDWNNFPIDWTDTVLLSAVEALTEAYNDKAKAVNNSLWGAGLQPSLPEITTPVTNETLHTILPGLVSNITSQMLPEFWDEEEAPTTYRHWTLDNFLDFYSYDKPKWNNIITKLGTAGGEGTAYNCEIIELLFRALNQCKHFFLEDVGTARYIVGGSNDVALGRTAVSYSSAVSTFLADAYTSTQDKTGSLVQGVTEKDGAQFHIEQIRSNINSTVEIRDKDNTATQTSHFFRIKPVRDAGTPVSVPFVGATLDVYTINNESTSMTAGVITGKINAIKSYMNQAPTGSESFRWRLDVGLFIDLNTTDFTAYTSIL